MLHEVAEFENVVVSCGGGTPCFFDNMDYMNQLGETLYLKASPETLHAHLKMGKGVRPLPVSYTHLVKGDKTGEERTFTIDSLKGIKITQKLKKEMAGSETVSYTHL